MRVMLLLGLLIMGCTFRMAPAATFESGPYRFTLLAPGGTLKEGENKIELRTDLVSQHGHRSGISDQDLTFSMPPMGTMPAMRTQAVLSPSREPGVFQGQVTFTMKATWQGTFTYRDVSGIQTATFSVQVR